MKIVSSFPNFVFTTLSTLLPPSFFPCNLFGWSKYAGATRVGAYCSNPIIVDSLIHRSSVYYKELRPKDMYLLLKANVESLNIIQGGSLFLIPKAIFPVSKVHMRIHCAYVEV